MDEPAHSSSNPPMGSSAIEPMVNLNEFCRHRIEEVLMLTEAVRESPFRGQPFQRLPKHMRRRQMSHHIKRLPRSMRQSNTTTDEAPPAPKRPSRKFRRRPRNLLLEYNRRQRSNIWLETHIWHSKRFAMMKKWGYKLAEKPTNKSFKACYRAATKHCFLSDISYYNCVELKGSEEKLLEGLQKCTSPNVGLTFAAKMFIDGSREGSVILFHPASYPYKAIGRVSFLWKSCVKEEEIRTIWIFSHPSFYHELVIMLKTLFELNKSEAEESHSLEGITSEGKQKTTGEKGKEKVQKQGPVQGIETPKVQSSVQGQGVVKPKVKKLVLGKGIEKPKVKKEKLAQAVDKPNVQTLVQGQGIEKPKVNKLVQGQGVETPKIKKLKLAQGVEKPKTQTLVPGQGIEKPEVQTPVQGGFAKPKVQTPVQGGVVKPNVQTPVQGGVVKPKVQTPVQGGVVKPKVQTPIQGGVVKPKVQTPVQGGVIKPNVQTPVQGGVVKPKVQIPVEGQGVEKLKSKKLKLAQGVEKPKVQTPIPGQEIEKPKPKKLKLAQGVEKPEVQTPLEGQGFVEPKVQTPVEGQGLQTVKVKKLKLAQGVEKPKVQTPVQGGVETPKVQTPIPEQRMGKRDLRTLIYGPQLVRLNEQTPLEGEGHVRPKINKFMRGQRIEEQDIQRLIHGQGLVKLNVQTPIEGQGIVKPKVQTPVQGQGIVKPKVQTPVQGGVETSKVQTPVAGQRIRKRDIKELIHGQGLVRFNVQTPVEGQGIVKPKVQTPVKGGVVKPKVQTTVQGQGVEKPEVQTLVQGQGIEKQKVEKLGLVQEKGEEKDQTQGQVQEKGTEMVLKMEMGADTEIKIEIDGDNIKNEVKEVEIEKVQEQGKEQGKEKENIQEQGKEEDKDKGKEKEKNLKSVTEDKDAIKLGTRNIPYERIPKYKNSDGSITMCLLKDTINRFRLVGPLSMSIISEAFDVNLFVNPSPPQNENSSAQEEADGNLKRKHSDDLEDEQEVTAKKLKLNSNEAVVAESAPKEECEPWWNEFYKNEHHLKSLESQKVFYERLKNLNMPSDVPPNLVFSLVVKDPRLTLPPKRLKSMPEVQVIDSSSDSISVDTSICHSPLWEPKIRDKVSQEKMTTSEINVARSQLIVPGSDPGVLLKNNQARIPLIVIQRTGATAAENFFDKTGNCSGFDLLVPAGWAMPVWLSLIFRGARVGGLREIKGLMFETNSLSDYHQPDSDGGELENMEASQVLRARHFKYPPSNRPNFAKLGVQTPFYFPWRVLVRDWRLRSHPSEGKNSDIKYYVLRDRKKLSDLNTIFQKLYTMLNSQTKSQWVNIFEDEELDCLIPVAIESNGKGSPQEHGMICLPSVEDIRGLKAKNFTSPAEALHADINEETRKRLKLEHSRLLKSLKRKRKMSKGKDREEDKNSTSEKLDSQDEEKGDGLSSKEAIEDYSKKLENLWLEDPEGIKSVIDNCSRTILGYFVMGDFSFTRGRGLGLGYITLRGLLFLLKRCYDTKSPPVVLYRNATSALYRLGTLRLCMS